MKNILTELSGLPPLETDQEAFLVYVSHQLDGERINAGPFLEVKDGPDAYQSVKKWIFEDSKIVDYNLRPLSTESYNSIRRDRAMRQLVQTALGYSLMRGGSIQYGPQ